MREVFCCGPFFQHSHDWDAVPEDTSLPAMGTKYNQLAGRSVGHGKGRLTHTSAPVFWRRLLLRLLRDYDAGVTLYRNIFRFGVYRS